MRYILSLLFLAFTLHAAEKPNIIFIFADDLGVNDLACYGRKEHHTPNLDKLAAEGMRFTSAYCAQPICSPSRAAVMTGKHPARLHLTTFLPGRPDAPSQKLLHPRIEGQLPLEEVTIAELLHDAGYATGMFGKWHLGGNGFGPKEQGFDTVVMPQMNTKPSADEGGKGEYEITAAVEKFIEENKARPFFCYVPHNTPHIPLGAKAELTAKNKDTFKPTYAAMIETLDDCVGRLMQKVESLGLTERTLFVFTSDNGGLHVLEAPGTPATHNAPFRAGKGFLYEGGLREPLIVRWPGVTKAGSVCDAPVVLTDLMPTFMDAAGIDPGKTTGPLDGASLTKLLRGENQRTRTMFWHFPHYTNQGSKPAGAMREGDWKMIEDYETGRAQLFDLSKDAGETTDLAEQEPERVSAMQGKLKAWRASVGAQEMEPNPDFNPALHKKLYSDMDASLLKPEATAALTAAKWNEWRHAMNSTTDGRKVRVTPASGDIRLHAKDARVHAKTMRYEDPPFKNVLGFWVKAEDWADWEFDVKTAGKYEVEVQQGCGKGSGGAEVAVEVGGTTLKFIVQDTGHFQNMILRTIGTVELPAGKATLAVKPQIKPGAAVMDLRRVVLRPVQ